MIKTDQTQSNDINNNILSNNSQETNDITGLSMTNSPTTSTIASRQEINSLTKRRKFFSYTSSQKKQNNNEFLIIENEISYYLNLDYDNDLDISEFWFKYQNKLPYLYKLSLKFLSIPASSGPCERIFSKSGYINRPHRARMTEKKLANTTFLYANINELEISCC